MTGLFLWFACSSPLPAAPDGAPIDTAPAADSALDSAPPTSPLEGRVAACRDVPQWVRDGVEGPSSGFEVCVWVGSAGGPAGTWVRRREAVAGDPSVYDRATCEEIGCRADEMCSFDQNAHWWTCVPMCSTDADCGDGAVCVPSGAMFDPYGEGIGRLPEGQCVTASCRSAADCGGLDCVVSRAPCASFGALACATTADDCRTPADCDGTVGSTRGCWREDGVFSCSFVEGCD